MFRKYVALDYGCLVLYFRLSSYEAGSIGCLWKILLTETYEMLFLFWISIAIELVLL